MICKKCLTPMEQWEDGDTCDRCTVKIEWRRIIAALRDYIRGGWWMA